VVADGHHAVADAHTVGEQQSLHGVRAKRTRIGQDLLRKRNRRSDGCGGQRRDRGDAH
jgi:hypothetical protein